jgi:flagellar secretion chaperone FliS
MSSDVARTAYQQVEANGSNGVQLIVMLYDGAIRFLGEAKSCAESGDRRGKAAAISRTLSILAELQSTLRIEEGGELAKSLDGLYTYITERILDANLKGNATGLDEAIRLLRTLNSAWTEIARRAQPPAGSPQSDEQAPERPSNAPLEFFG